MILLFFSLVPKQVSLCSKGFAVSASVLLLLFLTCKTDFRNPCCECINYIYLGTLIFFPEDIKEQNFLDFVTQCLMIGGFFMCLWLDLYIVNLHYQRFSMSLCIHTKLQNDLLPTGSPTKNFFFPEYVMNSTN